MPHSSGWQHRSMTFGPSSRNYMMTLRVTSRMRLFIPKHWTRSLSFKTFFAFLCSRTTLNYWASSIVTPCVSRTKRDQIQEAYCQITKLDVAMNGMLQRAKQLAYPSVLHNMFTLLGMPHIPMLSDCATPAQGCEYRKVSAPKGGSDT